MKITPLCFNKIQNSTPKLKQNFCFGTNSDTFEKSTDTRSYKVKIKDLDGNDVDAIIYETIPENAKLCGNEKHFDIYIKGQRLGYALVQDTISKKPYLNLVYLYTQEHEERTYKGMGTELLKCVVKESYKRGYKGNVHVNAQHSAYSPLIFYYKNNFICPKSEEAELYGHLECCNAPIQYAIKNNLPIDSILGNMGRTLILDEEGAKAFLKGEKLYKERFCKKINETAIRDQKYSASFVQSPYKDEYFLFIANEDRKTYKAELALVLKKEGKFYRLIGTQEFGHTKQDIRNFAFESLDKLNSF